MRIPFGSAFVISSGAALTGTSVGAPISPVNTAAPSPQAAAREQFATVQVKRNIQYVPNGGVSRSLDLYLPAKAKGPVPLVIWIHGGSWRGGDKERNGARFLTDAGFATASLNYRLLQEAVFPAQFYDCRAAVRFLRAHAQEYNLDPTRIGVWGESAGGNLAALLGTVGDDAPGPGETRAGGAQVSARVQAVCDFYGPTDLAALEREVRTSRNVTAMTQAAEAIVSLLGTQPTPALLRAISPIAFVSKETPPFLIVHGDIDPLVPVQQSTSFDAALRAAGASSTCVVIKNAGHGGPQFYSSQMESRVREFFEKNLTADRR